MANEATALAALRRRPAQRSPFEGVQSEVRMIPVAGHMVQLEASDAVNAILLDYLGEIRP